jgi:protein-S-isoprenylcysteine O-methyltransferase Ste14
MRTVIRERATPIPKACNSGKDRVDRVCRLPLVDGLLPRTISIMRKLELKVPPPLLVALLALAMWPLSKTLPAVAVPPESRLLVALAIGFVGAAFSLTGVFAFRRAQTTTNPLRPDQASVLVTTGSYRITRNPMYFGLMLLLLAWAAALGSPVSLAGPLGFIMYMNRFQIGPEERVLAAKFGAAFERYRAGVRRWI